jgi:hypothetical protein
MGPEINPLRRVTGPFYECMVFLPNNSGNIGYPHAKE